MRIRFLTPYFPPEVGAPQSRLFEAAARLAARGHEVSAITGFPNYPSGIVPPDYRGRAYQVETMRGVRVVRTWIYATPNRGFAKRLLNHLSYMVSAVLASFGEAPADVLFVESPPLFDGLAGWAIGLFSRTPYVFNVADLWPRSAVELGIVQNAAAIRLAEAVEAFIYRHAARVTAVTRGIERDLGEMGWGEKAVYLPNGVDAAWFDPGQLSEAAAAFRAEFGLTGRIALYAGTHGLSQALETILGAADRMRDVPDLTFLLVGDGSEKPRLVDEARRLGLPNVRFLDALPKERMPAAVAAADLYLVTLRDLPLFEGAVPSKLYEALSCARPVVASLRGEAATLIAEAGCGRSVPPEDPGALATAVREVLADPAAARAMGEAGRRFVVERFDRDRIVDRMERMLAEVVDGR